MECPPSGVLLWYDESVSGWAGGHLVTHQPQENLSATGHTVNSAQSLLEVSLASEKAHGLAVAVQVSFLCVLLPGFVTRRTSSLASAIWRVQVPAHLAGSPTGCGDKSEFFVWLCQLSGEFFTRGTSP